jgi:hypothetical protein
MFQCRDNKDMFFYVKTLFFQQLYPVFFSFFIISFIYFIKKKSYFFPFLLLFLFTVFSVMTNKAEKHILPLFPFIAIMISAWLFSLRAKTIAGIAILLSFLQFFCVSYLLGGIVTGNAHLKYFAYPYPPNGGLLCREIDRGNWKDAINQAIGLVKSNSRNGSAKTVFISDDVWDPPEIRYQSIIQGFKIDIPCPLLDSDIMILTDSEIESLCGLQIDRADFVMIEDSKEAINMKMRYQRELRGCFRKDISKFNLIGSVMFSENRPMSIYKRVIARSR